MAHPQQKAFFSQLQLLCPQYFKQVRVGEVGSLDINGSVREFFSDCAYTGLDADDCMKTFNLQGWVGY